MPKVISDYFTNWLIGISIALGGAVGTMVLTNQSKMSEDISTLKALLAQHSAEHKAIQDKLIELDKTNDKQDGRLDKLQGVAFEPKLFKHEDFITLKRKP